MNLIGALSSGDQRLHFDFIKGNVTSESVIAFAPALTEDASAERVTAVVLDNAPFHTSAKVKKKLAIWEQRNVFVRHLPPYCPHLNPIEAL